MTLPETGFSGGYLREILPRNFMISTCETGKRKRAPPDIGHAFLVFPPNKVPPPFKSTKGTCWKRDRNPKNQPSILLTPPNVLWGGVNHLPLISRSERFLWKLSLRPALHSKTCPRLWRNSSSMAFLFAALAFGAKAGPKYVEHVNIVEHTFEWLQYLDVPTPKPKNKLPRFRTF